MNYKYEVHQREWNSGNIVAIIFASNTLSECINFKEKLSGKYILFYI